MLLRTEQVHNVSCFGLVVRCYAGIQDFNSALTLLSLSLSKKKKKKVVLYGHCLMTLLPAINEILNLKWVTLLHVLMQTPSGGVNVVLTEA